MLLPPFILSFFQKEIEIRSKRKVEKRFLPFRNFFLKIRGKFSGEKRWFFFLFLFSPSPLQVSRRVAGRGCLFGGSSEGRPRQQPGSGVYRPGRWFIASDLDIERDRLRGGLDGERQGGLARLRLIGHFPSRLPDHVPAEGPTASRPRPGGHRDGDSRSGRCYELASRQRLLALLLPLQTGGSFFKEEDALS